MVKTLLMSASLSVVMLFVPIGAFSPDPLHGFSMPSSALAAQTNEKRRESRSILAMMMTTTIAMTAMTIVTTTTMTMIDIRP